VLYLVHYALWKMLSVPEFKLKVIFHLLEHNHQVRILKMGGRLSIDDYPACLTERHFPPVIWNTGCKRRYPASNCLVYFFMGKKLHFVLVLVLSCTDVHWPMFWETALSHRHCEEIVVPQNLRVVYIMLYMWRRCLSTRHLNQVYKQKVRQNV
jgi:hypothetical protein